MYHPRESGLTDGDKYEFLELKNTGPLALDLSGLFFSDGIGFTVAEGFVLQPGEFVVLASDALAFSERYPHVTALLGAYQGNLSNSGETVTLNAKDGTIITTVAYDDIPPWPVDPDGFGASLVPVSSDGSGDTSSPDSWRASANLDGSPGEDDPGDITAGGLQRPGDINQDNRLDISDAVGMLQYLFGGTAVALPCGDDVSPGSGTLLVLDTNGDARPNVADAVYLLGHLFGGVPPHVLGTQCIRIQDCPNFFH